MAAVAALPVAYDRDLVSSAKRQTIFYSTPFIPAQIYTTTDTS